VPTYLQFVQQVERAGAGLPKPGDQLLEVRDVKCSLACRICVRSRHPSAVRQATLAVTGRRGSVTGPAARWTPHITISYSTGRQSMAPIAAALGRDVPGCDIIVGAVSLVIQWGPERLWNWQPVGTASLGTP
jgi:hypothetical protein